MYKEEFEQEERYLLEAITWADNGLQRAPKGQLHVETNNGIYKFYVRSSPSEKKGTYIKKDNQELVQALAQKEYETHLLKVARKEKERLDKLQKLCSAGAESSRQALAAVYEGLPAAFKELATPYELSDDEYASAWQSREYAGNSHPYGSCPLFTRRGEKVRSKSEVIIADALDAAGVPYQYERPLYLGGYSPIYPDFTVLNKRTRKEYYWEHFGGLDDTEYREGMMQRVNNYALAGYFPGDALITTMETADTPLDTRVVNALIQRFFV